MPRRERSVARTQSLVAAGRSYSASRPVDKPGEKSPRHAEAWQHYAWDFFDTVPEYHQACVIVGSLLSRAKLTVHENGEPTTNPVALEALDQLFGGPEGQVEMLRLLGIHFSVVGGAWVVGPERTSDKAKRPGKWSVAANTRVSKATDAWKINGKEIDTNSVLFELWKPHPENPKVYDSPTRAVLPILSELHALTKRVAAQIDSRLTGNGLLLLPSETEFPEMPTVVNHGDPQQTAGTNVAPGDAAGMARLLQYVAGVAMQDQSSAEARLPIIATMPGEHIKDARHLTFWSELDKIAPKLREEGIRRVALGMDMPPEILLGNAGSNHWNAWLSDENSVKIHAEPLLKIITAGLTEHYLWEALEDEEGIDDAHAFTIVADTSQMRLRPNRSKEALELNDRLTLSDEAALRENGFDPADAMDEAGLRIALLRKMASGSTTPEIVNAAARILGVELPEEVIDQRPPAEARPTPSLLEHPTRTPPEQRAIEASAGLSLEMAFTGLVFAAEQMVDRALQRAGNRIKTKYGLKEVTASASQLYRTVPVAAGDIDDLLKDAWECTEATADIIPPAELARALDIYTRSLLASRQPLTRDSLASSLRLLLRRATP